MLAYIDAEAYYEVMVMVKDWYSLARASVGDGTKQRNPAKESNQSGRQSFFSLVRRTKAEKSGTIYTAADIRSRLGESQVWSRLTITSLRVLLESSEQ